MPKLTNAQEGPEVNGEAEEQEESQDTELDEDQVATSSNKASQRGRKRKNRGPSSKVQVRKSIKSKKNFLKKTRETEETMGDSWLSKESAGEQRPDGQVDKEESGEESSESGKIPPPKMTRAQYRKDKVIIKTICIYFFL